MLLAKLVKCGGATMPPTANAGSEPALSDDDLPLPPNGIPTLSAPADLSAGLVVAAHTAAEASP